MKKMLFLGTLALSAVVFVASVGIAGVRLAQGVDLKNLKVLWDLYQQVGGATLLFGVTVLLQWPKPLTKWLVGTILLGVAINLATFPHPASSPVAMAVVTVVVLVAWWVFVSKLGAKSWKAGH